MKDCLRIASIRNTSKKLCLFYWQLLHNCKNQNLRLMNISSISLSLASKIYQHLFFIQDALTCQTTKILNPCYLRKTTQLKQYLHCRQPQHTNILQPKHIREAKLLPHLSSHLLLHTIDWKSKQLPTVFHTLVAYQGTNNIRQHWPDRPTCSDTTICNTPFLPGG